MPTQRVANRIIQVYAKNFTPVRETQARNDAMGLMEREYQKYSILKRLEQIKRGPRLAFRAESDELEI